MLRLYNTLTRRVEEFRPIEPGLVRLYTCGLTVYNYAHIGNLRMYLFEDVLKRTLLYCGLRVRHVMNITDVGHLTSDADTGEDKMEKGAAREGKTAWEIAAFFHQAFVRDLDRLGVLPPDVWCKATDHIDEQIALVRTLEEKGYAYVIAGDGVYFDTSKFPAYGRMARLDVAGLRAGARVEMVEGKRGATDFALWKFSPPGARRQMEWPSPWGVGFPGWHVECSAMALKHLGPRVDIHCGGVDHIPVHHTNEIAQSEAALGHQWVNCWLHGEFLVMSRGGPEKDGEGAGEAGAAKEKMSKSAGEFLTLEALLRRGYEALAYRYFCLGAHYRQQLAFSWEALDAAASGYARLKRAVLDLRGAANAQPDADAGQSRVENSRERFRQAVEDDLNMPQALAALWTALRDAHVAPKATYAAVLDMDKVLGLGLADLREEKPLPLEDDVQRLIDERNAAREARDFARADEIRKSLAERGIALEDTPAGTVWKKA
jgi:cysteinyl-tRNA synthetase